MRIEWAALADAGFGADITIASEADTSERAAALVDGRIADGRSS